MKKIYSEKQINMYLICLTILGSVIGGVKAISEKDVFLKGIGMVCALASLVVSVDRNVYLPFLGDAVVPESVLIGETMPAGANRFVRVRVEPRRRVVYWAAEPHDGTPETPWKAYGKYKNSGVTYSDSNGFALLKVRNPTSYFVPYGERVKPHVHYRYMRNRGMMSKIMTVFLSEQNHVYGFS